MFRHLEDASVSIVNFNHPQGFTIMKLNQAKLLNCKKFELFSLQNFEFFKLPTFWTINRKNVESLNFRKFGLLTETTKRIFKL